MIICVEDDDSIRSLELYTLKNVGFEAIGCPDGATFFEEFRKTRCDLVILDIMLPDMDGVTILRKLRQISSVPVIMATAKGSEYDKVESLDLGADDYLVKPFGMMEMVSRIKAVLRRSGKGGKDTLASGGITVDTGAHEVTAGGEPVVLTLKEYELLRLFMENVGLVFTRDQLLARIWGSDFLGETRTVDVHIRRLREKIEANPSEPKYVHTKWGVGYYFSA